MKIIITTLVLAFSSIFALGANDDWTTDLEAAFKQAKKEKKHVLVEFTGSDWCPPCMMMRRNVFSKKSFTSKASKDFILVELDFPQGDRKVAERNEPHAEKYKIESFPTVILFNESGKEYNRFTASEYSTVKKFLKYISVAKKAS